ncbi:MAG: flagellar protein FlaG [Planctomycetota bacterium]|jgi:flagellar protein FlaG
MNSNILSTSANAGRSVPPSTGADIKLVKVNDQVKPQPVAAVKESKGAEPVDQEAIKDRLESSVSRLTALASTVQRDLQFSVDEDSGEMVITVLDSKTAEIIRQIPSKEVLALSQNIESLKGALFSAEV